MAEETANKNSMVMLQNISEYPLLRQLGLMVGLAASVALGVAIVFWSQSPDYTTLYAELPDNELSQVADALKQSKIKYKISAGNIMVPANEIDTARMQLAAQGLPNVRPEGFDILSEDQSFGTSQFIQAARYQHALEEELSRSISALRNVKSARVHLALPKESVFVRNRKKASASVIANIYSGHRMTLDQINAITYMVASSVPNLQVEEVTVVDQMGRLLTNTENKQQVLNSKQLEYTNKVEQNYIERVSNILSPFLGATGFKAQVNADIDFTRIEKTSETFNPDAAATRSKQQLIERMSASDEGGIPGALSNQPPGGSIAPENAGGVEGEAGGGGFKNKETLTQNFELDKTISHTRLSTGNVKRISIAVVIDDKKVVAEDGTVTATPRTEDELKRITNLVKEAVGFNAQRGDSVNIINAGFVSPTELEALPDVPVWEQAWFAPLVKQVLAALVVLYIIFGVIKPAFKSLSKPHKELVGIEGEGVDGASAQAALAAGGADGMGGEEADALPKPPDDYELQLDMARKLVVEDPKIAAQVVKNWLAA
ncbi:flagellar basal-body MS-ring/collar protein FliF [sulfur-oxidizing endosymbiont of Gigantopelta aegis]|uniref:flagellar basal-body MS-ring/collar protein FliF n=1 Tax=sulfur-oxidizing endosymbiont of Gigantopelta aegis TaxID=2794934 RepID=UPI0018DD787E|nr:flagellar basal-body MS-ring/collar protein FliF [sulfur-oxidizing endosymbiont of Gigantopelta aegis]